MDILTRRAIPRGYPLILAFFHSVFGGHLPLLFASLISRDALGLRHVHAGARGRSGALAGTIAALMLALSPVFITYSSLVMSDVPTLFVTICAALMLVLATSDYVDPIAELDANVGMADVRSVRRVLDDHPADQRRHSLPASRCAS